MTNYKAEDLCNDKLYKADQKIFLQNFIDFYRLGFLITIKYFSEGENISKRKRIFLVTKHLGNDCITGFLLFVVLVKSEEINRI